MVERERWWDAGEGDPIAHVGAVHALEPRPALASLYAFATGTFLAFEERDAVVASARAGLAVWTTARRSADAGRPPGEVVEELVEPLRREVHGG